MAKREDWMQTMWRPAMGWLYMLICFLDMAVFPVLWALWQGWNHAPITQWNPLTLQGAGLFHIAMGAVLGIAAFGRTQEKLAGTAANPTATIQPMTANTNGVPGGMGGGFGGSTGGFGSSTGGFNSPTPAVTGGFNTGFNNADTSTGFGSDSANLGDAPPPRRRKIT